MLNDKAIIGFFASKLENSFTSCIIVTDQTYKIKTQINLALVGRARIKQYTVLVLFNAPGTLTITREGRYLNLQCSK